MFLSIKGTVFLILQILNFFKIYLTDTVRGGGGGGGGGGGVCLILRYCDTFYCKRP